MFVMGDQNKMFGSLYDESDDRDAPIGSFKTLTNFIHSKTRSALQSRGGLIKDIDNFNAYLPTGPWSTFPSQCDATKGNLSVHKVINGIKFRLKSYPDVDFTLMAAVCRYDQNIVAGSAVDYAYVLKFFVYPFIPADANLSGASIATADPVYEWRDITPYYVDLIAAPSWSNTSGSIYEATTSGYGLTVYPFSGDLNVSNHVYSTIANRSIYNFKYDGFLSPHTHNAEGFRYSNMIISKSVQKIFVDGFSAITSPTYGKIRANTLFGAMDYNAFLMDPDDNPVISYEFLPDGNMIIGVKSLTLNTIFELTFINGHFFNKAGSSSKPGDLYAKLSASNSNKLSGGVHYLYSDYFCYGFSPFDFGHLGLGSAKPTSSFTIQDYAVSPNAAAAYTATISGVSNLTISPTKGSLSFSNTYWAVAPADNALAGDIIVINDILYGFHLMGLYCTVFSVNNRAAGLSDGGNHLTVDPRIKSPYLISAFYEPYFYYKGFVSAAEKNGVTKPSDEAVFTNGNFIQIGLAKYSGYRYAMHSDAASVVTTPATYVLGVLVGVPAVFDKRITDVAVVLSDDKAAASDFTSVDAVNWKVVIDKTIRDNDIDQWDMLLVYNGLSGQEVYMPTWVHKINVGKNYYNIADRGGNHLLMTGNPEYSRYFLTSQSENDIVLACKNTVDDLTSKLYMDYEFGPEDIVIARDRVWVINPKFRYMQIGNYKTYNIMSDSSPQVTLRDNAILYSPIGEGGPTYHLFDFGSTSLFPSSMGDLVAISKIGLPQGLSQAVETERNNLLCLFRGGYQYWNLSSNDPSTDPWTDVRYEDDTCISRDSVAESNGFVFCVGNTGVYMFLGTQKVDLTKLGGAKITKTWSAISTTYKEKTIGVFYPTEKWYIAIVPDLNKAYVFHLQGIFDQSNEPDKIGISEFEFAPHIGSKIVSACLHEGYIYIFCNDSTLPILKYDPLSFGDYINASITSGAIVKTMQPNYIVPDVRRTKLNNLQIDYLTSDSVTVELYADTRTVNTVTLVSGEKLVNVNPKFNQSSRALRYSMKATVSGNRQTMINLLDFSVAEVVQKRLTRRDV